MTHRFTGRANAKFRIALVLGLLPAALAAPPSVSGASQAGAQDLRSRSLFARGGMNQLRQAFNILDHQCATCPLDQAHACEAVELASNRFTVRGNTACDLAVCRSRDYASPPAVSMC